MHDPDGSSKTPADPAGAREGWAARRILQEAWNGFSKGWRALPEDAARRFGGALLIGLLGLLLLSAVLVAIARSLENAGALEWERELLAWIEHGSGLTLAGGIWMQTLGNSQVTYSLVAVGTIAFALARRPLHALSLLLGFAWLKLAILFGWVLWPRARPEIILGGMGYSPHLLGSYPSGHVAGALFVFGWFTALWMARSRRRTERLAALVLLMAITCMVSAGRIRIGAHWPTDILSAWILAGSWLLFVAFTLMPAIAGRRSHA